MTKPHLIIRVRSVYWPKPGGRTSIVHACGTASAARTLCGTRIGDGAYVDMDGAEIACRRCQRAAQKFPE